MRQHISAVSTYYVKYLALELLLYLRDVIQALTFSDLYIDRVTEEPFQALQSFLSGDRSKRDTQKYFEPLFLKYKSLHIIWDALHWVSNVKSIARERFRRLKASSRPAAVRT